MILRPLSLADIVNILWLDQSKIPWNCNFFLLSILSFICEHSIEGGICRAITLRFQLGATGQF
jgi:hypothetical protein